MVCQILREQINGRLQSARLPISIRETLPGGEGVRMARAQGLFVIVENLLEQGNSPVDLPRDRIGVREVVAENDRVVMVGS